MRVTLVAYGIAREILNAREKSLQWEGGNIAALKTHLITAYPRLGALAKLSFAVGEEYRDDAFNLSEGDEVVIIPPVSGG